MEQTRNRIIGEKTNQLLRDSEVATAVVFQLFLHSLRKANMVTVNPEFAGFRTRVAYFLREFTNNNKDCCKEAPVLFCLKDWVWVLTIQARSGVDAESKKAIITTIPNQVLLFHGQPGC